ncbi:MAG: chemotaxis protein CheB, partial [Planctomycetota bacterium]
MSKSNHCAAEESTTPPAAPKHASIKPSTSTTAGRTPALFPIVGIGASAGGLEALEHFFTHVPQDSGMAFVVVQHLDPTQKGMLPELLQRITPMKVMQAQHGMEVQANHVYVIPANKDLTIVKGRLQLWPPTAPRGQRLPIDTFLCSLAQSRQNNTAAIILSGMGSDGVLGLQAVKEAGGGILVQDPASARYSGMPQSAIDACRVDIVAPPEELPARLVALFQDPMRTEPNPAPDSDAPVALAEVIDLLRTYTGHDFSLYKMSTISRRVERRMGIHQIKEIDGYVRYLGDNVQEVNLLFKELLIGVTNFFRDPPAWDHLRDHALPALLSRNPASR